MSANSNSGETDLWAELLTCARTRCPASELVGDLAELYGPIVDGAALGRYVVAHLGQSLDGRIALPDGMSNYVTGPADAQHNHRLRALCDAIIVGARTIDFDDPELTTRLVAGDNPVRVVIDPVRRLDPDRQVFCDGAASTVLVCAPEAAPGVTRHGDAEIVTVPTDGNGRLAPHDIVDALAARGLNSLFIEGGGITVSRFVEAGLVDRLQLTVAPILLGDGRPVLTLPPIERIDAAQQLRVRVFELGDDVLYDGVFDGGC